MPTNVRIKPATYSKLRQLAEAEGISLPDAVEAWYRRRFLTVCNEAYARMKADPKAWKTLQAERKAWDVTLNDAVKD